MYKNVTTSFIDPNELATTLYKISKEKRMINHAFVRFKDNRHFSQIFNTDHLSSLLNETIAKMVLSYETYTHRENFNQTHKKTVKAGFINLLIANQDRIIEAIASDQGDEDEQSASLSKFFQLNFKSQNITKDFFSKTNLNKLPKSTIQAIAFYSTLPPHLPTISENLNLSTMANITGYLLSAYSNNVSKEYKKHITTKREGESVSYESGNDSHDSKEGAMIFNQLKTDSVDDYLDKQENKQNFYKILNSLREYDKEKNANSKGKKVSNLRKFFVLLISPKYKGKFCLINKVEPMSHFIFNKRKDELVQFLKENFQDEFINYNKSIGKYEVAQTRNSSALKKEKVEKKMVSTVFEIVPNKNKFTVSYNMIIVQQKNNFTEQLKSVVRKKTITSLSQLDEIKSILIRENINELEQLKQEATFS